MAWSCERKIGANGRLPAVGIAVEVKTASFTDAIGAAQLATGWTYPDFKPGERVFCFARVLEIPTPRLLITDDAVRTSLQPLADAPATKNGARVELAHLVCAQLESRWRITGGSS